ncbi:MAG: hypothetical protein WCD76_20740 [Pyrinomonadaceae bacterium]
MAKRITEKERLALRLDNLNESEVKEVLEYISIMESMRRAALPGTREDDLILHLADSFENQRARQAFEWEAARRRAERRAAVNVTTRV